MRSPLYVRLLEANKLPFGSILLVQYIAGCLIFTVKGCKNSLYVWGWVIDIIMGFK